MISFAGFGQIEGSDTLVATIDSLEYAPGDTSKPDSSREKYVEKLKAGSDLEAPVTYEAHDSIVFDMEKDMLFLFKSGKLNYTEITLQADSIAVDFGTNLLIAGGLADSSGVLQGKPVFRDDKQDYTADWMAYNYKTQRGKVRYVRTKMGDEYISGDAIKMDSLDINGKQIVYIKNGTFTSCSELDPHFYIRSSKLKVIPNDKIVSGPLSLVVGGFPLPIGLPFGFFPNQEGRRSGLILPEYGEAADRGFFLKSGGYFLAVNDFFDLAVTGDIYTKGGWRLEARTNYKKRYWYNGTFSFETALRKFGEEGDPGFSKDRSYFVKWNHQQNIDPTSTFRASVNAGSSNYLSRQSYDTREILTNTLKSNISYNKKFSNSPYTFTLNLDHSQNTATKNVTLGLPNLTFSRARAFPFQSKGKPYGKFWEWAENIGISYNFNARNQISVPDSLLGSALFRAQEDITLQTISEGDTTFTTSRGLDYYRNGMQHSIPLSTKISLFRYLNISPAFNFNEYWNLRRSVRQYFPSQDTVVIYDEDGFFAVRDFDFSVSAQTQVFGFYRFTGKRKPMIRHTINPAISYNFNPDFSQEKWNIIRQVQADTLGTMQTNNQFGNSLMAPGGSRESQSMSFSLNNRLEMKYRNLKEEEDSAGSTKEIWKKFVLIDNFSLSGSYNFAADSLNMSPVSSSARTTLFNNKLNIQLHSTFEPYSFDSNGRKMSEYYYNTAGRLFWISQVTLTAGTSFRSRPRGKDNQNERKLAYDPARSLFLEQYVDFQVPWSLNINYNLTYTNSGVNTDTIQSLRINGDFSFTPKWKLALASGYDFDNKEFTFTTLSVHRDLHCWDLSFNWVPFGTRKSFIFTLNVKNPTLKDLKITKRSNWQDRQF